MYQYKVEINSGPMKEIKYYKSLRKRDKKNIGRALKKGMSPEKQKIANKIRSIKNAQRLILCNFKKGDIFARFSAPYEKFTEEEFNKVVNNFFKRVRRRVKKENLKFKYIGYCECGKRGENWHLHIVIEKSIESIITDCWPWKNGINFTPLYTQGNFKKLAEYIHKDVKGQKRLKTSRNLIKPNYKVTTPSKKEVKKIERGEMINIPADYHLVEDEMTVNDYTGAAYSFTFMQNESFSTKYPPNTAAKKQKRCGK